MKKIKAITIVLCVILFPTCLFMWLHNQYPIEIDGFGLTEDGALCLGTAQGISIGNGKTMSRIIPLGRGEVFEVKNGFIRVTRGNKIDTYTFEGALVTTENDDNGREYLRMHKNRNTFIDSDGNEYTLVSFMGCYWIYQITLSGSILLFSSSSMEVMVKALMVLIAVFWFVSVVKFMLGLNLRGNT